MPEKYTKSCPDLTQLEQQAKGLQKQNNENHLEVDAVQTGEAAA